MADRLEIETVQALADFRSFLVQFREHCQALIGRAVCEIDESAARTEEVAASWTTRLEEARQALDIAYSRCCENPESSFHKAELEAGVEALARCERRIAEVGTARRRIADHEERSRSELARARTSIGERCERGIAYLDRIGGLLEEYTQIIEGPVPLPPPPRQLPWSGDRGEAWQPFYGPLFGSEPAPNHVRQSDLGDCYFLAPLVSLANQHSKLIREAIRRNVDGTFTVRLFEEQRDGSFEPVYVTVDNRLPVDSEGLVKYARTVQDNSHGLWVSILEKAYAQFHGGYEHIGNGGRSEDGLAALTGSKASTRRTSSRGIWAELRSCFARGAVVCAMKHHDQGPVPGHHVYAILGASEVGGRRTVTLRNPWGNPDHPSGYGDKFTMGLEDFCRAFGHVAWSMPRRDAA